MFAAVKRVDFYRKVPIDLTEPTAPGAIISILAIGLMMLLFLGEIRSYIAPPSRSDMFVASDEGHGRLKVVFNMSFPKLPCFVLSLDVLDVLGRHEVNVQKTTKKTRISNDGRFLSEYADDGANTNDAAWRAMTSEGCNIAGYVKVHKVPGNFHVSAHGLQDRVSQYLGGEINVQHTIHHLHFGSQELHLPHDYEGQVHPLNGESHLDANPTHYEYYLDIVPTVYTYRHSSQHVGGVERGYQYTSNMHKLPSPPGHMAAAFFQYQLSPITVSYGYERPSFSHFITYTCAIIGGVFTVAGILSRVIHSSVNQIQRRLRGKDQ